MSWQRKERVFNLARDTEHKLDSRSSERIFICAATSIVKPERSPLVHVESELAENVQLKKVLLSSAEEELRNASREIIMTTSTLFQLLARGSVEIVTNLDIQHRDVLHVPALSMTIVD